MGYIFNPKNTLMNKRNALIATCAVIAMFGIVSVSHAVASQIANNNLKLYGKAFNPTGYFTVADDMVITKELNAKGNISDSSGTLTFDDDVAVTGDIIVEGGAEIKGEIYNSNTTVTVNDDLAVTGEFSVNSMSSPDTSACDTNGTISYDPTYLYICVDNIWKKVALENL